jgi:hypothetical protein
MLIASHISFEEGAFTPVMAKSCSRGTLALEVERKCPQEKEFLRRHNNEQPSSRKYSL